MQTVDIVAGDASGVERGSEIRWTQSLRSVFTIWFLTRVLTIGAVAALAVALGESFSRTWSQWDAGWFLHIAENGYGADSQAPAFYPFYPLLLRTASEVLQDHAVLAGVLLALPLTLIVFVLLHALALRRVGEEAALRAVAYLALFPYAFFLQALYSETAYLALAIGAFLAAERRRFLIAGTLAGGAMLARPLGPAVLAGVAILAVRSSFPRQALARLAIAPVLFLLFPLVLVIEGRGPLAFLHAEDEWRDVSPFSAFYGLYRAAQEAWRALHELAPGTPGTEYLALVNVTALLSLVVFAALSVAAWRRLGSPYGVYCMLSLAVPIIATTAPYPLASMQRFVLTLFPCFIVLGALPIGRTAHRVLLTLCAVADGRRPLLLDTRGVHRVTALHAT